MIFRLSLILLSTVFTVSSSISRKIALSFKCFICIAVFRPQMFKNGVIVTTGKFFLCNKFKFLFVLPEQIFGNLMPK